MPRLTEQEQQEVIRYIEADKPLPDKYRFLLFGDKREVELVWNGKTNEVCNVVLPFQTIEQVDEPRSEETTKLQMSMFDLDNRGRQLKGWTNKLIWGDNKLILSSLKNGPMREEIERQGGIKLIYIDPPFDVGADFSMDIEIGDDTFTKQPNILEEIAYRDTWGNGADSFISMIYERLILMRDLLAEDGSIYVQCDWRLSGVLRLALDEIFGKNNFRNEIVWVYGGKGLTNVTTNLARNYGIIFFYTKTSNPIINLRIGVVTESVLKRFGKYMNDKYQITFKALRASGDLLELRKATKSFINKVGREPSDEDIARDYSAGSYIKDVWDDIPIIRENKVYGEYIGYPTQKPEALMDRIIKISSNQGDLVADLFSGSGTTASVAEKLGRKWIAADLGKFAIHTTRKRMIQVQRQLKSEGQNYRAFEILNLGKYERQHYIGVNLNLREAEQQKQLQEKEANFINLILTAYRAEKIEGFRTFAGKKAGRLVAVGPVNLPVTRLFVEEIILECREKRVTKVDILGFEFEMGLFPNVLDEAKAKGIDISPKYIPREVFDKRAVEKNQVVFHNVSYVEVKPHVQGNKVAVELTDFSVFYSQDSIAEAEANLKNKGSKIIVDRGQIIKVSKDAHGLVERELLTKTWTDWIDYWAVDFDFENKREIIRQQKPDTDEWEEVWTGEYIFENEWQSFRTKKNRTLELKSVFHECTPGRRKIAVKVVDIFGTDTMTIIEVNVGGKV